MFAPLAVAVLVTALAAAPEAPAAPAKSNAPAAKPESGAAAKPEAVAADTVPVVVDALGGEGPAGRRETMTDGGGFYGVLDLAPGRKSMLLHPQLDEAFEVADIGITAAGLPLRYSAPGDMQQGAQPGLCQADGRPQRQHGLAEGIVSLIIQGPVHWRSPFCVTQRSETL